MAKRSATRELERCPRRPPPGTRLAAWLNSPSLGAFQPDGHPLLPAPPRLALTFIGAGTRGHEDWLVQLRRSAATLGTHLDPMSVYAGRDADMGVAVKAPRSGGPVAVARRAG